MDDCRHLYVSNGEKHEITRWKVGEAIGVIVTVGNGQGDRVDQLNNPRHIFINEDHSVYVSDRGNHKGEQAGLHTSRYFCSQKQNKGLLLLRNIKNSISKN